MSFPFISSIKKAAGNIGDAITGTWHYGIGSVYPSQTEIRQLIQQPGSELGIYGSKFFLPGYLYDEWLDKLAGREANDRYREMYENNAVVAATVNVYKMYLRSIPWYVKPASEEAEDKEAAKFLESAMDDMYHDWQSFIAEVGSEFVFGFAPFEIVYKVRNGPDERDFRNSSQYDDGLISWQAFKIRGQQTLLHWDYNPEDPTQLIGLTQIAAPLYRTVFIPREKLLLFVTEPNRNLPTGRSPLRSAFRSWFILKYLEDLRNQIIEHGGLGILKGTLPPDIINYLDVDKDGNITANPKRKGAYDQFIAMLKNCRVGNESWIVVPAVYDKEGNKLYDVELMSSNITTLVQQISGVVKEKSWEIMQTVMVEMLSLGSGAGSYALSKDKTNRFTVAISCYADGIEATLNEQAVKRLFGLNPKFKKLKKLPEIKHAAVEPIDIKEVAVLLSAMAGVGLAGDWGPNDKRKVTNALMKACGLPELTEEPVQVVEQVEPVEEDGPEEDDKQPPKKPSSGDQPSEDDGSNKFAKVQKFNENHDEKGRFAEGSGGKTESSFKSIEAPHEFISERDKLPGNLKAFLTLYSSEEYKNMGARIYLSSTKRSGFALKPDGELISVFSLPGAHEGHAAVEAAIKAGAKRLDCLGETLRAKYEKHGFKVVEEYPWNDEYRPRGWNEAKYGRPNVYLMELKK